MTKSTDRRLFTDILRKLGVMGADIECIEGILATAEFVRVCFADGLVKLSRVHETRILVFVLQFRVHLGEISPLSSLTIGLSDAVIDVFSARVIGCSSSLAPVRVLLVCAQRFRESLTAWANVLVLRIVTSFGVVDFEAKTAKVALSLVSTVNLLSSTVS